MKSVFLKDHLQISLLQLHRDFSNTGFFEFPPLFQLFFWSSWYALADAYNPTRILQTSIFSNSPIFRTVCFSPIVVFTPFFRIVWKKNFEKFDDFSILFLALEHNISSDTLTL